MKRNRSLMISVLEDSGPTHFDLHTLLREGFEGFINMDDSDLWDLIEDLDLVSYYEESASDEGVGE